MSDTAETIRPAIPDDLPALHALVESAYRGDSAKLGWTHEADMLEGQRTDTDELAAILADDKSVMLALLNGQCLVACVHVKRVTDTTAYLGMFAVSPTQQGSGIGKRLLIAAEHHAAAVMAVRSIEMTVIRQRLELIAFYERRGYVATGEERPFPLDDERFGLPNRRDLSFIVLEKTLAD
jgi:ribosomal protein S18 acetylase RimI-like enzyme